MDDSRRGSKRATLPLKFITACLMTLFVTVQSYRGDQTRDANTFYTAGSGRRLNYKGFWTLLRDRKHVVLRVKSCGEATIRLAHSIMHSDEGVADVSLGVASNSKSHINSSAAQNDVNVDTPGILHCGEFRTFWISWGDDSMSLGKGPVVGVQPITSLQWNLSRPHEINELGFASGGGYTAAWQMEENLGYNIFLSTFGDHRYRYLKKGARMKNGFITFKVLSCGDIHVALQHRNGHVAYEVSIGVNNNTQACITDDKSRVCENHVGLALCTFFKVFWIGWRDGVVKLGKGSVYDEQVVISRTAPEANNIDYISPTTGNHKYGLWILDDDLERRYEFFTSRPESKITPEYRAWTSVARDQTYAYFRVQACADSWIAMSKSKSADPRSTLHVLISKRHTAVYNFSVSTTVPLATQKTPSYLTCDLSVPYFVSWRDGRVRLGSSAVHDVVAEFTFNATDTSFVKAIGFASTHAGGAHWTVLQTTGSDMYIDVDGSSSYKDTWVTTKSVYLQVFRVRACKNVAVLLTEVVGAVQSHAYEITIGGHGHVTSMRDMSTGKGEQKVLPGLLSCNETRTFWLGWRDGRVRLGSGFKYGREELLAMAIPSGVHFNALSLSNPNVTGHWEFDSDYGSYFVTRVPATAAPNPRVRLTRDATFLNLQLSGEQASIILSPSESATSEDSYHVVFDGPASRLLLKRHGRVLTSVSDVTLLSGSRLRDVWLTWDRSELVLGESKSVGEQEMLRYRADTPLTVKSVAVASLGSSPVEWKCSTQLAEEVVYTTGQSYDIDQLWLDVEPRTFVVIGVTACGNASVVLSGAMHDIDSRDSYVITLHGPGGLASIRSMDTKTVYVAQTTSELLSCSEERLLWISWHDGQVAVGRGVEMGHNIVMAYEEMNSFRLTALSVTTDGSSGTWRFPIKQDSSDTPLPPVTSAPANSGSSGLSSAQIIGLVFGVLAIVALVVVVIVCVTRHKNSFGLGDLEDLRDTTSVTSSQGYTNSNVTSNI